MVNELLSVKRVDSLVQLLSAYRKAGIKLLNAIDGGAGAGHLSSEMLGYLEEDGKVFAFEPFPGNHRFFTAHDERIVLIPEALADERKQMKFHVPSVVSEESAWGRRGMAGYSSGGRLIEKDPGIKRLLKNPAAKTIVVDCVMADDVVADRIDFVKLDLQGGELNALKGMSRILADAHFLWIEFSGQEGLIDFLKDKGYILFDTEYFFRGESTDSLRKIFDISKENVPLSNGKTVSFGFKKCAWNHFEAEFFQYKKELGLVQTDLVCVHRPYLNEFVSAIAHL